MKRFVEERELTVMLVVDVSRSMRFGTTAQEKRELAAELCALLGFAAMRNNDRLGLVLAAGDVEHFVPPSRGRTHVLRMLRDVLDHETDERRHAARGGGALSHAHAAAPVAHVLDLRLRGPP